MKKTLILASILAFTMTTALAAESTTAVQTPAKNTIETQRPEFHKAPPKKPDFKKEQFEKRLNLSDKQKAKAKELREQGRQQMQPLMEQIKSKRTEADTIRANISDDQKAQLDKLNNEIRDLEKQAHELRMKNMKDFESILTKKQKKELEKMKQEGRRNFDREHRRPGGPEFRSGFGPGFGHGPAIKPQPAQTETSAE